MAHAEFGSVRTVNCCFPTATGCSACGMPLANPVSSRSHLRRHGRAGVGSPATKVVRRFEGGQMREMRGKLFGKPASLSGFLEDLDGNLWLGSYGGGIVVLGQDGTGRQLTRQEGLPSDLVRCLFQDREGNLWAGLEARGLVRIRHALFASYARTAGMSDETVLCVSEDNDANTWLGTNGEGVYRIARDGQVRQYGLNEGLSNLFVWTLQTDGAGRLWAGTWGGGLFRLVGEHFVNAGPEFSKMPVVLKIFRDRRGAPWF